MRIEQLKYFLEVADSGSINATAQHLFISQQGISDALKRMEQELGVTLLNRSKTGISLTADGEAIYPLVKPIVTAYEDLETCIFSLKANTVAPKDQVIRILANPLSMTVLIPDLLELLEKHHPLWSVHCTDTLDLNGMIQHLQTHAAEIGIFMLMKNDIALVDDFPSDIQVYQLFEDELVACVATDSEFGKRKSLSLVEFNALEKVLCNGAYISPKNTPTEYISNNVDFQLKLLLKKKIASVTLRYFFPRTFPCDVISAICVKPALKVRYYVMFSKEHLSTETISVLEVLRTYILELTGQAVAYDTKNLSV